MFSRSVRFAALAGLLAAAAAGCGKSSKSAAVSGVVKYQGRPVTAGVVTFHPVGGGDPVRAELGSGGEYRASGVPAGPVVVTVQTSEYKNLTPPPKHLWKDGKPPAGTVAYVPTPAKYEGKGTSPLQYEINAGDNAVDIVLE